MCRKVLDDWLAYYAKRVSQSMLSCLCGADS